MTTTASTPTAADPTQDHDRPCWCNICLICTVDDLLDERAKILRAALLDHAYTPGFERNLAEELMHAIPADKRAVVLDWLVTWEHLSPRVMAVDSLLDETDRRSYAALEEMGKVLLSAIHAQNGAPHALKFLLIKAIDDRRELLKDL